MKGGKAKAESLKFLRSQFSEDADRDLGIDSRFELRKMMTKPQLPGPNVVILQMIQVVQVAWGFD